MRISDWSSDVCSSDLTLVIRIRDKAVIISPCALDMGAKQVKQRLAVHEPVKLRHPVHRGCTPGDGVGLLIVHHLETMLDRPVNAVGFGKVIDRKSTLLNSSQ